MVIKLTTALKLNKLVKYSNWAGEDVPELKIIMVNIRHFLGGRILDKFEYQVERK